jgi:two-component sensor histidine kinase
LRSARAHERLYGGDDIDTLDLGAYIGQVCKDLEEGGTCEVHLQAQRGITVAIDRAVPAALIITELVTNAAKYAYRDDAGGKIWVRVAREGDRNVVLAVRDEGDGLPPDFDVRKPKGLGMRIVSALTEQLNANITVLRSGSGAEFVLHHAAGNKILALDRRELGSVIGAAHNPRSEKRRGGVRCGA